MLWQPNRKETRNLGTLAENTAYPPPNLYGIWG